MKEEEEIVEEILTCADWGMPLAYREVLLDSSGTQVSQFKNHFPGEDWYHSFVKRHKDRLSLRKCPNFSKARAAVGIQQLKAYFGRLADSLSGIPPSNILNYDETILALNPCYSVGGVNIRKE